MKKLIFLLVGLLLVPIVTLAMDQSWLYENVEEQVEIIIDEELCYDQFSDTELAKMEFLYRLLDENIDVFAVRVQGSRWIILAFQGYISDTLSCYDWWSLSYQEFSTEFSAFIQSLILLKKSQGNSFTPDVEAEAAILMLQQHLLDMMMAGYGWDRPFNSYWDVVFSFVASDEDNVVDLMITAETEGNYDLQKDEFEVAVVLDASVYVEGTEFGSSEYDEETSTWYDVPGNLEAALSADLEVLQKNDLFVKLGSLDLEINSDQMEQEMLLQTTIAQGFLQRIVEWLDGQYIQLTSEDMDGMTPMMLLRPSTLFTNIANSSVMDFYRDGDVRYGKLNQNACSMFWDFMYQFYGADCEEYITQANMATQWKWYFVMQKEGDEYILWITDKFMGEDLVDETIESILFWNEDEITKLDFPLGVDQEGYVSYEDGEFAVVHEDGGKSIFVEGTIEEGVQYFEFVLDMTDEGFAVEGVLTMTQEGNENEFVLDFVVSEDGEEIGSGTLMNTEVIKYLMSVNIEEPSNVFMISEVEDMFMNMGME